MTETDSQWLEEHLKHETTEYLENVMVTLEERQELLEWVKSGESIYSNPLCMTNESGWPMDYNTARRV